MAMNDNREVTFEIVEEIGILTEHSTGWNKEINLVSWNGNSAKYDIRDWSPDHAQMGRGITLHEKEMRMMLDLLKKRPRKIRSESHDDDPSFMSAGDEEKVEAPSDNKEATEDADFCVCTDEDHDDEEPKAAAV